jgi:regulator of sigma E protease
MFITIIVFLLVLSVLVFAHEWGHFWTARRLKIRAEEFGLGFPPRVFGWQVIRGKKLEKLDEIETVEIKTEEIPTGNENLEVIRETIIDEKREIDVIKPYKRWRFIRGNRELTDEDARFGTVYSLNWIPIGGFVKIKGENGEHGHEKDSFSSRPIWQRLLVLVAGVLMNVVLAFFLFALVFSIGMPQVTDGPNGRIQIEQVAEKSPAQAAGVLAGDIIVSLDQQNFSDITAIQDYVNSRNGQKIIVELQRGKTVVIKEVTPQIEGNSENRAVMGVSLDKTEMVRYPWYQAIWQAAKYTISIIGMIAVAFYELIRDLIMGQNVGDAVGGPVRIAQMTGQVANIGFVYLLNFVALLSLNLAIINILPFPPLDGGRVLFLAIESIRRKPVKKEVETVLNNIGFLLLMALLVWVTFKDILNIFH